MDKIHREIVTNVLLNHTYFTKIAFIEGKSEKSFTILNFLIYSAPSIFVHENPRMEYSPKKKSMKILFNSSLDQSYVSKLEVIIIIQLKVISFMGL